MPRRGALQLAMARVRLCPQQAISAVARVAVPGAQPTPRVAQRCGYPQPPRQALPEGILVQLSEAEAQAATEAGAATVGCDGELVLDGPHLVS